MNEKIKLVELKFGDQPEKYDDHILIFDGRKGVNEKASRLASKLYHLLKSLDKNPVLYTNNDTINPEKMTRIIITETEQADSLAKIALDRNISYETILDESHAEHYCKSI